MTTAWIEKIWNLSNQSFTILQNDGTWRPYVQERNKSYASDEAISVSPGDVLTCEHFFIPWIDWVAFGSKGQTEASKCQLDRRVIAAMTLSGDSKPLEMKY